MSKPYLYGIVCFSSQISKTNTENVDFIIRYGCEKVKCVVFVDLFIYLLLICNNKKHLCLKCVYLKNNYS